MKKSILFSMLVLTSLPILCMRKNTEIPQLAQELISVYQKNKSINAVAKHIQEKNLLNSSDKEKKIVRKVITNNGITISSSKISYTRPIKELPEIKSFQSSMLHIAAYTGNLEAVKTFLAFIRNPDHQDGIWNTPLMYAVQKKHKDIVSKFLDAGAQPDKQNLDGKTALHYGAKHDKEGSLLRLLLSRTNNFEVQDNLGNMPTHEACLASNRKAQLIFIKKKHLQLKKKQQRKKKRKKLRIRHSKMLIEAAAASFNFST